MAKRNIEQLAFNRGVVSPFFMARTDVTRLAVSAETQTNWMPMFLGPMSLRPGLKYIAGTYTNLASRYVPFVFSNTDLAAIELTDYNLRVVVSDAVVTRPSVTTTIANGGFNTDLTSWTVLDEGVALSSWLAGGYLSLLGTGTSAAIREQAVALGGGSSGVQHALRIVVTRGPVLLRVGSSSGAEDYIAETRLLTGTHSLTYTPTGTAYVRFFSREKYPTLVDSCAIEAAGAMVIPTPVPAAYLSRVRSAQSGDVVFLTCYGVRQLRIERRAGNSWSVVDYISDAGPFRGENITDVTVSASALNGLVTLTASAAMFKSTHVGAIFKLVSNGQSATQTVTAQNTFTNAVLVTGTGVARAFGITVSGTWVGTVTLQRSVGILGNWVDVVQYTVNQSVSLADGLDNQTIYYRLGIKTGQYTSGSAVCELVYSGGSVTGIARISAFTSATSVTAYTLKDFGSLSATAKWSEGVWSSYRGFPSCVALREGRLWMAGKDKMWASVVDDFGNHDPSYIGDAGPVNRSIGDGPVDTINWLVSASELMFGAGLSEFTTQTSFSEPVTPLNFSIRPASTIGSSGVDAVQLDQATLFVDRSNARLMELLPNRQVFDVEDLTLGSHQILLPGVVRIAVQRRPDTRIHCVRSDGTVAVLVRSKVESVNAWVLVTTNGLVEDVFTLPGTEEDSVYYVVARTVAAATVRYLEKWAFATDCVGGLANKQADAFVYYNGAPATSITGLGHLEGLSVVCWADGVDQGVFTVSAGAITLPAAVSKAVVGLGYTAQFKSVRLATAATALIERKRVVNIGVLLMDTHAQGLKYGSSFTTLDDLPLIESGTTVATGGIWANYNYSHIPFNGVYTVDSRLCLQAAAPRPCTVLATVVEMDQ